MLRAIVEQHAEDAAFLWTLRARTIEARTSRLDDLVRLDARIEANLDGVRIAGKSGAKLVKRALAHGDAGEIFAAAVLAFETGDSATIGGVVEASPRGEDLTLGLGGALSWVSPRNADAAMAALRRLPANIVMALLVGAMAHRRDPRGALDAALLDDHAEARASALRAIGELRLLDHRHALSAGLHESERSNRYWAGWSLCSFKEMSGALALMSLAASGGPLAEEASAIAAISIPHERAVVWIDELAKKPELARVAIRAAAALGDTHALPMLIDWLETPTLARVAGDAITTITAIAIEADLAAVAPSGFTSGPSDDPDDEDVATDPDDDLAWPSASRVAEAWKRARPSLPEGTRHIAGRAVTRDVLERALREGRQSERARAAFELARMGEPLFDVTAKASRQLRALATRTHSSGRGG